MASRIRYLSLNDAQPGMVLARPLVTSDRGWLEERLPAGQVLNEALLDKLRRGHTEAVCIDEEDLRTDDERAAQAQALAERLGHIFRHADRDHAPTNALKEALLAHRLAHADGDGNAPMVASTPSADTGIPSTATARQPEPVTWSEILARMDHLPAFPAVVRDVLSTLEDDDSNLWTLTRHLQHDPVIAARVLSLANRPVHLRGSEPVRDVFTAVNLVGLQRIRQLVVSDSLIALACQARASSAFWQHSLAVALAVEELAPALDLHRDLALVTGLVHDLGALWLRCCRPEDDAALDGRQRQTGSPREVLEREWFGIDHAGMGRVMAEHWGLPAEMAQAIEQHHEPRTVPCPPLVAATHLAEMICNGLDLPARTGNEVDTLSDHAVAALGSGWAEGLPDLLGRVQARFVFERDLLTPTGPAPVPVAD